MCVVRDESLRLGGIYAEAGAFCLSTGGCTDAHERGVALGLRGMGNEDTSVRWQQIQTNDDSDESSFVRTLSCCK